MAAHSVLPDGILLSVRLTPKAARDEFAGSEVRDDGREVLKARVRAVPEDGKANAALIRLAAKVFGLPASAVELASGQTSRTKVLKLGGGPEALAAAAAALAADKGKGR